MGDRFCSKCGTQVDGNPQPNPQPVNQYAQQAGQQSFGAQPKKYQMISKYEGEPTVGIAKATGRLCVYQDRLEYVKAMGNALASSFGLLGMALAVKQEQKKER